MNKLLRKNTPSDDDSNKRYTGLRQPIGSRREEIAEKAWELVKLVKEACAEGCPTIEELRNWTLRAICMLSLLGPPVSVVSMAAHHSGVRGGLLEKGSVPERVLEKVATPAKWAVQAVCAGSQAYNDAAQDPNKLTEDQHYALLGYYKQQEGEYRTHPLR